MIHLQEKEKKLYVFRKHWLSIAKETLFFVILAILPLFLEGLLNNFELAFKLPEIADKIIKGLYLFWVLILWVGLFVYITNYVLDAWILTSQRLIDIEQIGLFSRNIATLDLGKIQDITVQKRGLINEIFNIGTLVVQTAAMEKEFTIPTIGKPEAVKEKIMSAAREKEQEVREVRVVG